MADDQRWSRSTLNSSFGLSICMLCDAFGSFSRVTLAELDRLAGSGVAQSCPPLTITIPPDMSGYSVSSRGSEIASPLASVCKVVRPRNG